MERITGAGLVPITGLGLLPLTGPGIVPLAGAGLIPPAPIMALGEAPIPDREAQPSGFLVTMDGAVRIHFLDWDGGVEAAPSRPPGAPGILLVHGLAGTAWSWAPVARRLRRRARVVAMDLRGHGLSDAPTEAYDPDQLAADATAVAEGAGLLPSGDEAAPRPFVLAGIGFGAVVAAWAAAALGRRCAGLVLVDSGWEDLAETTDATADEWLAAIEEPPAVLASMDAWLADRAAFDPATWDADQERAVRAQVVETAAGRVKLAVHPHALRASVEAMLAYRPATVLPAVEAPVTVLVAGDDEARRSTLVEVAELRAAARRSPIRAAAFPGRGHNLVRYEPDVVAAAVLAAGP